METIPAQDSPQKKEAVDQKGAKVKSINDYQFMKSIGEGAFGKVYMAIEKETQRKFAVKTLDKQHIVKHNKTKHVYRERDILGKLASVPTIVKLEQTFQVRLLLFIIRHYCNCNMCIQDKLNLYFIFEYCEHGSLNNLINKAGKFTIIDIAALFINYYYSIGKLNEDLSMVYAAEIVAALEFIHKAKIMHRDLKPENIMINTDFHLKIV